VAEEGTTGAGGDAGTRWGLPLVLVGVFLILAALSVALPVVPELLDEMGDVWSREEPDPGATNRVVAVACNPDAVPELCSRMAADLADRTYLSAEQRTRALTLALPAIRAMRLLWPDPATCEGVNQLPYPDFDDRRSCVYRGRPVSEEDVRRALAGAGFPDATVRTAREDDPAPSAAVLYGVALGDACLVGYAYAWTSWDIIGRLPDGACLRP
jgi:hypothetical protein